MVIALVSGQVTFSHWLRLIVVGQIDWFINAGVELYAAWERPIAL